MLTATDHIVRESKLPIYQQLYEILRGKIVRGEWQPGALLPSETELIEQYSVSRVTARQALDALVQEGLIHRQRGRGSFVSHPTVEQALTRLVSFTDDMRQRGFTPGTQVLETGLLPAPPDIAARLSIQPGEELLRLVRLRLADGEPMSVEETHLVHRYCPGLLELDYRSQPLREILERRYGIRWSRARQQMQAINATAEQARVLSVKRGAALLYIERVSYSMEEIPIEFLRLYHRGDRYTLHAELRG
ncbi:MAG: GntR family transcriptional regulator [Anaerolineae bacterium]